MRSSFKLSLLASLLTASLALHGQAPPPHTSQTINPDRTVTFRYIDPASTSVSVVVDNHKDPFPMTKGADGLWTVTTPAP